jgi:hypothetical protein
MRWILGLVVAAALGAGLWLVLGHDGDSAGHEETAEGRSSTVPGRAAADAS